MSDVEAAWAAHDDRVDALMAMTRERDELHAEVERLQILAVEARAEAHRLHKESLDAAERAQAEIEQLRAELRGAVDAREFIRRQRDDVEAQVVRLQEDARGDD